MTVCTAAFLIVSFLHAFQHAAAASSPVTIEWSAGSVDDLPDPTSRTIDAAGHCCGCDLTARSLAPEQVRLVAIASQAQPERRKTFQARAPAAEPPPPKFAI